MLQPYSHTLCTCKSDCCFVQYSYLSQWGWLTDRIARTEEAWKRRCDGYKCWRIGDEFVVWAVANIYTCGLNLVCKDRVTRQTPSFTFARFNLTLAYYDVEPLHFASCCPASAPSRARRMPTICPDCHGAAAGPVCDQNRAVRSAWLQNTRTVYNENSEEEESLVVDSVEEEDIQEPSDEETCKESGVPQAVGGARGAGAISESRASEGGDKQSCVNRGRADLFDSDSETSDRAVSDLEDVDDGDFSRAIEILDSECNIIASVLSWVRTTSTAGLSDGRVVRFRGVVYVPKTTKKEVDNVRQYSHVIYGAVKCKGRPPGRYLDIGTANQSRDSQQVVQFLESRQRDLMGWNETLKRYVSGCFTVTVIVDIGRSNDSATNHDIISAVTTSSALPMSVARSC